MNSKTKIIYLKENTFGSILQDTFSFGAICASFWFNYTFVDGNNTLDTLLFIVFFLFAVGKAGQVKRLIELQKQDMDL